MILVLINGKEVLVTGSPGLEPHVVNAAVNSKKFQDFVDSIDPKFDVAGILIQSVDLFPTKPDPTVGFLKLKAEVTLDGKFVPGIVFIRGDSVGILVVLNCEGVQYTLLAVQPRIGVGSAAHAEIPAGMLDGNGDFAGVAAKELNEEAGIRIRAEDLAKNDLRELVTGMSGPIAMSPGGSDEMMHLFVHEENVTWDQLAAFKGKLTGELDEGETITLKVIPLSDVWEIPDMKTIAAIGFYSQLAR